MRNWMKNAGHVALVGAGFFAIGSGIASADVSDNHDSLLSGNQVEAPVSAPINVSGNALGLLGGSASAQGGGQRLLGVGGSERSSMMSSNRRSLLSGNQVKAPISVPVNACGNAIAGLSSAAQAACTPSTQTSAPVRTCGHSSTTWTAPKVTCNTVPAAPAPAPVPAAPASACQPVAPATKAPCESTSTSSVRTLPATSPFSMTSMTVPVRRQHSAAQEVTTYEKLTSVRQAAGAAVDGSQSYVAVPSAE